MYCSSVTSRNPLSLARSPLLLKCESFGLTDWFASIVSLAIHASLRTIVGSACLRAASMRLRISAFERSLIFSVA